MHSMLYHGQDMVILTFIDCIFWIYSIVDLTRAKLLGMGFYLKVTQNKEPHMSIYLSEIYIFLFLNFFH
jgi:hypothetical protein